MAGSELKVNTLIIGAAKAGTTSLAAWLDEHPDCKVSNPKETSFFSSIRNYDRGYAWYHETYFANAGAKAIYCDATPAYTNRDRHPGTPSRAHLYNPGMKLIYMVRNPLDRVISAWQMFAMADLGHADPVLENDVR